MSADEFHEADEPAAEDAGTGSFPPPVTAAADDASAAADAAADEAALAPADEAEAPVAESADEALAEETPAAEVPADEALAEETPAAEVPADEALPEETSTAEEAPAAEVPAGEDTPAEAPIAAEETEAEVLAAETPGAETPAEAAAEAPVAEVPAEETPVAEVPAADGSPVEAPVVAEETEAEVLAAETPGAETPAEAAAEVPVAEAPSEAPAAEAPAADAPIESAAPTAIGHAVAADSPDAAEVVRTAIVEEAERLSTSSDWTKAANGYRELLARWRAVGSAGREVDDALWARFSTARDTFFERRNAHHAERSRQSAEAAEKKKALIVECEALLELGDPRKLGDGLDRLMAEWKAAGRAGSEDQALWQQFRAARDRVFALRRELAAARQRRREDVKVAKQGLIEEAKNAVNLPPEQLQAELDRLMTAWKRAGSAGRDNDDALWQEFRAARGAGFSRLRQAAARAERQAANAAHAAEATVVAAQRMAFSDSAVSQDDVARLERTFARASDTVDSETKEQFEEALGRLRDRAEKSPSAIPSTNPLSAARAKLEQGVKELEERVATLRAEGSRDLGRAEKRLAEERQKLERMHSLMGS